MRPSLSLSAASSVDQRIGRVRDAAAERAGVQILLRAAEAQLVVGDAAEAVGDRRHAGGELAAVADDDASQASFSRFAFTKGSRCWLPTSSSPSIRNFTWSGKFAAGLDPGFDAFDVREHLAFVVGRAAGVDVAVADGRLERRADPFVERLGRLHVVVAIDEHDRLAGHRRRLGIDERMAGGGNRFRSRVQAL